MQYLTADDVTAFYAEAIGNPVLRSPDGLASAVGRPRQSAFGEDAYPTLTLKAAALMQSLAENQPFVDGNKRIAWICGKVSFNSTATRCTRPIKKRWTSS